MQTRDDRIRAHYKGLKVTWGYRNGDPRGTIWMHLAQHWKVPIRQLKLIVKGPVTWETTMELPTQRKHNGRR